MLREGGMTMKNDPSFRFNDEDFANVAKNIGKPVPPALKQRVLDKVRQLERETPSISEPPPEKSKNKTRGRGMS